MNPSSIQKQIRIIRRRPRSVSIVQLTQILRHDYLWSDKQEFFKNQQPRKQYQLLHVQLCYHKALYPYFNNLWVSILYSKLPPEPYVHLSAHTALTPIASRDSFKQLRLPPASSPPWVQGGCPSPPLPCLPLSPPIC